ncbi:serine/threonine protein kinase [Stigmatella hybrida]|uniref:serine/threonine protein kinase n=1 Tax=Stigmatella hybrida TaxID=394097 RepID=UPI001CDAD537|nr:serine/threonine-protein kinase [Stigmatella hybrida]
MIGAVELEPGTLVDGWQIIRALRTGGFGAVHHAEQQGKPFAIKVALHREQSGDTGRTHARALREVAILLTMAHPHIIKTRGFGYLPDGRVYCVLEYVDGWTLGDWLERTHPTFQEITRVFAKIAGAIAYMHGRGVLHRDLKLSNVMIRKNGEPVIIDLGCATYANAEELTTTPLPPGTERYRAPEAQEFFYKQGRKRGARYAFKVTDELFAVGIMLHELLTDPLPTKDKPRSALADSTLDLPPPRDVNPRVPQALSALVESLVARAPALRPESFEALRRELLELADHPAPEYAAQAHPPSLQRTPGEGGQGAGLAARGNEGWRKILALADKHASRVRGRLQPRALAGMRAASRQHWRKPLALAGMVAALVLAAGAAAWLTREHPAPASPTAPREAAPAAPLPAVKAAPVPALAQDSAPAVSATAPKEGSPVKPKPPDALKSPRATRATKAAPAPTDPGFPAWCKALPLAVAMATNGCASVRIKAEPFECSPGAVESMERLGWEIGEKFVFNLDEQCPARGLCEFTLGGPVTGVVPNGNQPKAPPGTLFYGRIYVTDEKNGAPYEIRAIYDHVELPGKAKVPVCVVSGPHGVAKGAKDGTALATSPSNGRTVRSWAP